MSDLAGLQMHSMAVTQQSTPRQVLEVLTAAKLAPVPSALIKAMDSTDTLTARDLAKRMLKAVMEGGFMILHQDEMQDAMLMTAQIKTIVDPQPTSQT